MYYKIEDNKITFYKLSLIFKCLIAFILFIAFSPFIVWLFISKTFIQKIIMLFIVFIFVFVIPLLVLLGNKKTEILRDSAVIKITIYLYKYFKEKEIKILDIEAVYLRPIIKRKSGYNKKWWQIYIKTINQKIINLYATTKEDEAKKVAVNVGQYINKDVFNEENKEIMDYKLFEVVENYIHKVTKKNEKIKQNTRPKNTIKDDYGKRAVYRWYNINGLEMTISYLIIYLLIYLNIILFLKKHYMFNTSLKLTFIFVIYFIFRCIWQLFLNKGFCELSKENIAIKKNIFSLPNLINIPWFDIKDIIVDLNYRPKLTIKTNKESLSLYMTKDKIYWLRDEIGNFIKTHF